MRAAAAAAALPLALLPVLAGCGTGSSDASGTTTLTVFAAASLQGSFEELGRDFEADHDGVDVVFAFAGSSDLVAQVQQGADADVVATADESNLARLTADDLVGEAQVFATNTLELAVPPGNPAGIRSLADAGRGGVKLVVCAPQVPCGAATVRLEEAAGVDLHPVSEEQSVTDVLNKVISGEADAGLVYVTDVQEAAGDVEGVQVPQARDVVNRYPVATVTDSEHEQLAREFVDLVAGARGRQVLARAGFAAP